MKSGTPEINFKQLVESHQEKVRNTCFRFLKNREDAEDVAQDVFIQVHDSLDDFRSDSELSTWIYRIAVNKSLDFLRKQKRKKRFTQLTSLFGINQEEIVLSPLENPHQDLERKERNQILDSAIDKLPESQKIAITLSRYEGFSNKDLASIMKLSVSAVEALLHRAKWNLRKNLSEVFEKKF
jgi:RNA polymerase sigma-70 factor, ECF subfamily